MSSASNFTFLEAKEKQLWRFGILAEKTFSEDPNTSLLKLRQFTELLTQKTAVACGKYADGKEAQYDLLRRLRDISLLPPDVYQMLDTVRRHGNVASHDGAGDHATALSCLKISWQLGLWYYRTFHDARYKSGVFIPPANPESETESLQVELERLKIEAERYQKQSAVAWEKLEARDSQLSSLREDRAAWEALALEADREREKLAAQLAEAQKAAEELDKRSTAATMSTIMKSAAAAAGKVVLDESDTRRIIDSQLKAAGWEADTDRLRYAAGARPHKGRNLAIAEWPTASGPADYVLFIGLRAVATLEAKRKNVDVSASLVQAKRYSRDIRIEGNIELPDFGKPKGGYRVPFAFSSNGRPYLRQLETKSGIWFCDLRRSDNLSRPLDGWYTPEGLEALLARDEAASHTALAEAPFNYSFTVRDYQQRAIRAVETAIAEGKRAILLAMATGTGKTKTCIALIYRLLKTRRFKRILFLVDRSALGEQAAGAFKDTLMEGLKSFADIYGIKELEEAAIETSTAVHIATVQGMVRRVLNAAEDTEVPPIDQYDCIVVDECHRGYLLDRELSDTEMEFRDFADYVSKYRRVLDRFDAVKIGLTATPALHTSEIFGEPIYTYSYREAVIDGYLVDYEPPIRIDTKLSTEGIYWAVGERVPIYRPDNDQIELFRTPDEIHLEVDAFNRSVITENFNRVVCEYLAKEIDPAALPKTLVFCVDDAHADLVVRLLKVAFQTAYGTVDDDAVVKITGAADKPLELIRKYKNERLPSVAVTVDLLTTGIDVPAICNLVFLRRVNSRILFDQMLGRATRLCDFSGAAVKDSFRVFDAVRLFDSIHELSEMKPVVVDPKTTFAQLTAELATLRDEKAIELVRAQLLAKFQAKRRHLGEDDTADFEAKAGMSPADFVAALKTLPPREIASWFTENPGLGEILDRKGTGARRPVYVSEHEDELRSVSHGYGEGKKPEDYLEAFTAFVKERRNEIPALIAVLTRPRDLTRADLRSLLVELAEAGFTETGLSAAWYDMTNQDVAARIVGFIRRAAVGDPLVPFSERVDRALRKTLAAGNWTTPQRDWLRRIAGQTQANLLVDRAALDDEDLVFKREGGGYARLDRIFDGRLEGILNDFNDALWDDPHSA